MTGAHISLCWRCRHIIHHIGRRWVHKGGVAYSHVNGDHMASPFDPDETSAGDNPPEPARDDPSPRDIPRHRGEGPPT